MRDEPLKSSSVKLRKSTKKTVNGLKFTNLSYT